MAGRIPQSFIDELIARTDIVELIAHYLKAEGFVVDVAGDGEAALQLCRDLDYRLIILDVLLPAVDGLEVCRSLRRQMKQSLILMLTAKDSVQDKIDGLRSGADDYLTKPFAIDELLARIHALLRRAPYSEPASLLTVGDLALDPATRRVRRVLGLLEPFLELAIEELALVRLRRPRLAKPLLALGGLGAQRAERRVEVGHRALARRLLVGNDRLDLGVNRQLCLTAGALDRECRRHRAEASIECGTVPDLTNDFSWSRSRDNVFSECKRRYFYHYYGAWGGWEAGATEEVRRLYVLKQLASRQMWAGRVVHDAIEMALAQSCQVEICVGNADLDVMGRIGALLRY